MNGKRMNMDKKTWEKSDVEITGYCGLRRPLLLLVALALSLSQIRADYTTWIGGDGNWGDVTKWSNGVPSSETPVNIFFETTGEPYTVTLDRDVTCGALFVKTPPEGVSSAPVTLAGQGDIHCTGTSTCLDVQNKTSFVLDGPNLSIDTAGGYAMISGDFEIKSGSFAQNYCIYITGSNTLFKVSGGTISSPRLKLSDQPYAAYEQTGGYAWFNSVETTTTNPVSITGGIFRQNTLTVPIGSLDRRGTTNIANTLSFRGGKGENETANYCGPFVAIGSVVDCNTTDTRVGFPLGITFGSIANWGISRRPTLLVRERFHFDTADFFDRSVAHTITLSTTFSMQNALDLAVYGGGTFSLRVAGADVLPPRLNAFTLGAGTTMTMVRTDETYHRNNKFTVQRLKLGANSELSLMMKYNAVESTDAAVIEPGAVLNMHIYGGTAPYTDVYNENRYIALVAGMTGRVDNITINLTGDGTAGWSVRKMLNCAWIDNGATDMTPDTSSSTEWCGGSGGNLSTAANWSKGAAPASLVNGNNSVTFKTMQGVVTNDVDDAHLLQFSVAKTCGPLLVRGKPLKVRRENSRSSASAVRNLSLFPLVFENDVIAPVMASCTNFNVIAGDAYPTYVAFLGKLTVGAPVFDVCGHVLIGGEATANSVLMNVKLSNAKNSMLEILSGGSMVVSSQSNAFNRTSNTALRVNEGGELSFTGGTFVNAVASEHRVYGHLDIGVPLSSSAKLAFFGDGRLDIASTRSTATATAVQIGEGLHLYPHAWSTITADGDAPITLSVETHATIGATNDWTYGPAAGVATSTTAAERALVTKGLYAPLTIDTTDPDTGVGHTITFADPIHAAGDVFVKGIGAVCFASGEDAFGQNLSFDPTAALKLSPSQRVAVLSGWSPVVTAAKIVGTPMIEEGIRVRVTDNANGTQSIECFVKTGTTIVIR